MLSARRPSTSTSSPEVPICVDLDGTLVRTDTLHESLIAALLRAPWLLLPMLTWLASGKARFKERVSGYVSPDPALLPYDERVVKYLREQKDRGRTIVLASASHRSVVQGVAAHLGLFDRVMASDGDVNLRGERKAEALTAAFPGGFDYIGNDDHDLPVWRKARSGLVANASAGLVAKARQAARIERVFERDRAALSAMLRALRPHQWSKNLLIFVPMVTSNALGDGAAWLSAALSFVAFCLVASSIYVINDLMDLAADRAHPRKRMRPFASGAVPPLIGFAMFPVLLASGVALGATAGILPLLVLYGMVSVIYSMRLKHLPLADIFTLSLLYTLRLFCGGVGTGYLVSFWLLGFSGFLFLSLACVKRVAELIDAAGAGQKGMRRGYVTEDAQVLTVMGVASTFASVTLLTLFVHSSDVASRYAWPEALWGLVPVMLFWQCRLWLSTTRGYMHDDPIVYSARDWVSWVVVGIVVLLMTTAYYLSPASVGLRS